MVEAKVTMWGAEYILILFSLFLITNGLDCRSEGGPKDTELKRIYNLCLKQQNKNNNSNNGWDFDHSWREMRNNHWPQDNLSRNRGNANSDNGKEETDQSEEDRRENNRHRTDNEHKTSRHDRTSKNRDNRMKHRNTDEDERTYSRDGDERMYSRNGRNQNNNGDNRSQRNNGVNDRNDFFQNEDFKGYSNNQYSTQPSRRYKRERRTEINSGKRSQYNPNSQRFSGYDDRYKDENQNSNENNSTSDDDTKSCALHCLLENLKMTDESGMPDRYLVTHAITNDVKDEDLKDFLQESIEECFQILDNENTDDKCEFSKSLLMCLSEKGRANCDDWKDDFEV